MVFFFSRIAALVFQSHVFMMTYNSIVVEGASPPMAVHSPTADDLLLQKYLGILDDTLPNARSDVEEVFSQIKETLVPIILASPKNEHGRLDDSSARYLLYRLFMDRHGWVIKSFGDSAGQQHGARRLSLFSFGDIVPEPVQKVLEQQVNGRGSSIVELTFFAAMLEHLIKDETVRGLEALYALKRFPVERPVGKWQAEDLVDMYMASYIGGQDIFNMSIRQVSEEKKFVYSILPDTQKFFRDLINSHAPAHSTFTFKELADVLVIIVRNFVHWNNHQCGRTKAKLMEIEDDDSGRVRLLDFYRSAIRDNEGSRFRESENYLRQLGALDESNPLAPSVMISNYIDGPSNCVARTGYYSVCCMDECADLYSHLENALGNPTATPEKIIPVVEGLNSASQRQCRELPETQRLQLREIAKRNGGNVELHSQDFAEWMHFVYPRECANVKTFGPAHFMTVEEWVEKSPTSPQASDDDIIGTIKKLEIVQTALKELQTDVNFIESDVLSHKKDSVWLQNAAGDVGGPNASAACSAETWSCLFCIVSMLAMTWKLQRYFGQGKETKGDLGDGKLADWSEIV